jgi:hypothetical protein
MASIAEATSPGDYDLLLVERVLLGEKPPSPSSASEHPLWSLSAHDLPKERAELISAGRSRCSGSVSRTMT